MNCPCCKESKLVMSERSGVEIDYCPNCRGVWLDRGELDKILERAKGSEAAASRQESSYPWHHSDDRNKHYRKPKSFLEELFD